MTCRAGPLSSLALARGLGRRIARAFADAGAPVVAVARNGPALAELATTSANIRTEVADAADAAVAWSLVDRYQPEVLILVAAGGPVMHPLQHQTWETFSVNWNADVKITFAWLREALLRPLAAGSRVVRVGRLGRSRRVTGQRRVRGVHGHPGVHRPIRPG